MKRIIAASLAFAMVFGLSACGSHMSEEFEREPRVSREPSSQHSSTDTTAKNNKKTITVDPFENVTYTIQEFEGWGNYAYPSRFEIEFEAADSPLGKVAKYTYFIESADDKQIVIRSRANIDNDEVQKYMDENNLKVQENEKTFIIDTADLKTDLLSSDNIDNKTKEKLKTEALELAESELKMSEDEEFEYAPDALGIMQNNPDYIAEREEARQEFEKKKEENLKLKFKAEKLYVLIPKEIEYNLRTQKIESSISHHSDNTSFEDVEIYSNKATLEIQSNNAPNNCTFAILSDNNGMYYGVNCASLTFKNGELQDYNLKLLSVWSDYAYDSEKDIYDKYIASYFRDMNEYDITEIKL